MLKRSVLAGATAAAGAIVAVTATGLAGAAPARPPSFNNCATGIYQGYCGTQVSSDSPKLSIAVNGFGEVVGASHPRNGTADWFWFSFAGGKNDIAEFAPDGVTSNRVMAQEGNKIVLEQATGNSNQQWFFSCTKGCSGPTYIGTWKNAATGQILSTDGNGGRLRPRPNTSSPTSSEQWTFVTP